MKYTKTQWDREIGWGQVPDEYRDSCDPKFDPETITKQIEDYQKGQPRPELHEQIEKHAAEMDRLYKQGLPKRKPEPFSDDPRFRV